MENINKIAALAAKLPKKPNKSELFEIVEDIIHSDIATDTHLANLYAFFMPTVTKIKSPFHWLVKARGNKDKRENLNHVFSDGIRTYSTDGHRAHVINEKRPAGYYDDNDQLIHDHDWAKYPDINQVIPKEGKHQVLKLEELPVQIMETYTAYLMPDGKSGMNKKYIDQACGLSPDHKIEFYYGEGDTGALAIGKCKITYDNAEAVIMGLRR